MPSLATAPNPWPLLICIVGLLFIAGIAFTAVCLLQFIKRNPHLKKIVTVITLIIAIGFVIMFGLSRITKTSQVVVVDATCNIPGADTFTRIFPGKVWMKDVTSGDIFPLRFPTAGPEGSRMKIFDHDGKQVNTWHSYTFCDPDAPFPEQVKDIFDASQPITVTYNRLGIIRSWQLIEVVSPDALDGEMSNGLPDWVEGSMSFNEYTDLTIDLNGDDRKEKVTLTLHPATSDDEESTTLTIDNQTVKIPGRNPQGYFGVVDFDTNDLTKEIAVSDPGPSGDYTTTFYRYDGQRIIALGTISGLYEAMRFDGEGKLTTSTRAHILDTWFYDDEYVLSNNVLVRQEKEFYARVNHQNPVTVLSSITLRLSPLEDQTIFTVEPGEVVIITGCDDIEWCALINDKGMQGWFSLKQYGLVGEDAVSADTLFNGLSWAD